MKTKTAAVFAAAVLSVFLAAQGCGTDEKETADAGTGMPEVLEEGSSMEIEDKTEVSREHYTENGREYTDIYYSDGSVETEEH